MIRNPHTQFRSHFQSVRFVKKKNAKIYLLIFVKRILDLSDNCVCEHYTTAWLE